MTGMAGMAGTITTIFHHLRSRHDSYRDRDRERSQGNYC